MNLTEHSKSRKGYPPGMRFGLHARTTPSAQTFAAPKMTAGMGVMVMRSGKEVVAPTPKVQPEPRRGKVVFTGNQGAAAA